MQTSKINKLSVAHKQLFIQQNNYEYCEDISNGGSEKQY
ncbi:MAG: hypothetical protein JWR67_2586 [Mucilaginibacter sp.]|nr:hypothetical protein [Mucilaginibacter sp.]